MIFFSFLQTATALKIVFGHNSATDFEILFKFCVGKQFFPEFWQWDRYQRSTERIFCFLNEVWALID